MWKRDGLVRQVLCGGKYDERVSEWIPVWKLHSQNRNLLVCLQSKNFVDNFFLNYQSG